MEALTMPPKNQIPLSLNLDKKAQSLIIHNLWRMGDIRYKLKPCQIKMHEAIEKSKSLKYTIKCSRRVGKSYYLVARGTMRCLQKPNTMVRYAAPTNKSLKTIIQPIMRKILLECPQALQPRYLVGDGAYVFQNGSIMYMSGVNAGHAENLRGNACDEFIIDEAGTIDDLEYLLKDIAMPQLLDVDGNVVDGRRLIVSGTPARTPAHEFTSVSRQAQLDGSYSHFTIYAGGYPDDIIEIFKKEAGGEDSSTWKREYLAMDVVDENIALVPEWKDQYVQEPSVDEFYPFYHKYVSLDIGVRDLTVGLLAHYDFQKAVLYIHKEVVLSGPEMTTQKLAHQISEAEKTVFGEAPPHKRVSDVDLLLLNDLRALHGLYFSPTDKGRLEEMVNEVRIWVNAGRVIVSPQCHQLVGCLAYGVWNEKRTDFDRVPEYGHFDALASLMYMIRNIDQRINPIPVTFNRPKEEYWHPDEPEKTNKQKLKQAFNLR